MVLMLVVLGFMIAAHEAAHAYITHRLGGTFEGLTFNGAMVGVKVRVDGLSRRMVIITLLSGSAADLVVALVASVLWQHVEWWGLLLGSQWLLNLVPWGFPNDGTRIWRLWRWGAANARGGGPATVLDFRPEEGAAMTVPERAQWMKQKIKRLRDRDLSDKQIAKTLHWPRRWVWGIEWGGDEALNVAAEFEQSKHDSIHALMRAPHTAQKRRLAKGPRNLPGNFENGKRR